MRCSLRVLVSGLLTALSLNIWGERNPIRIWYFDIKIGWLYADLFIRVQIVKVGGRRVLVSSRPFGH